MNRSHMLQSRSRSITNILLDQLTAPASKCVPRRLLASLLLASCIGGAAAQEGIDRCLLCIPYDDAATYTMFVADAGQGLTQRYAANKRLLALVLAFERVPGRKIRVDVRMPGMTAEKVLETVVRGDLVCDGVSLLVDSLNFSNELGIGFTVPGMPNVMGTLCIGTVTTVDEFRGRPYKKFFDGEKKALLERLTGIEQLASKESMRATFKDLLDNDLKAQRAVMVSEVAAEAVRLLEQPIVKKK